MLHYLATPRVPREELFKSTKPAVNTSDPIMLADPIGTLAALLGPQEKSHLIESNAKFPMGHQFIDPSYQKCADQFYNYLNDRYSLE